jgi:ABC-type glycerol-3-phosphate transport system substrate-binding protein
MENKQKIIIGAAIGFVVILIIVILMFVLKKDIVTKGDVKLQYWGFDDKEALQKLADKFTEKNKSITIEYTKKGETPEEYQKILNEAIASGEGPDLFQIRNDWLPMNYKKMDPMPKTTYTNEEYKDAFFSVAYDDLSRNEQLYAVPFYIDTLAIYFNKEILDNKRVNNPGKTWEDFQKATQKMRELNGDFVNKAGVAMGTDANILNSEDILYLLMLQNGTTMTSPDLKTAYFNLSSKDRYGNIIYPGATSLDYYSSYAMPTKENYTWNSSIKDSRNSFIDGKTAMYFGYSTERKILDEATNKKLQYEISKTPQILGNEAYLAKYWATGVSKDSNNKTEAWKFLKTASEKINLLRYAVDSSLPSARKDVANSQSGGRYIDIFLKQSEKAQSWNKGNWEETDEIIREAINSVYTGKATGQQALDKAAQKVTPILAEANK